VAGLQSVPTGRCLYRYRRILGLAVVVPMSGVCGVENPAYNPRTDGLMLRPCVREVGHALTHRDRYGAVWWPPVQEGEHEHEQGLPHPEHPTPQVEELTRQLLLERAAHAATRYALMLAQAQLRQEQGGRAPEPPDPKGPPNPR
jgi:hypothetical protein